MVHLRQEAALCGMKFGLFVAKRRLADLKANPRDPLTPVSALEKEGLGPPRWRVGGSAGTIERVVNIMQRCWHVDPDARPGLRSIIQEMDSILDGLSSAALA